MKIYKITSKENNFNHYLTNLLPGIKKQNLKISTLGYIDKYPLLLLTPHIFKKSQPNILIAAGFHGNEIAPVWAITEILKKYQLPKNLNISFLPLINPTGFIKNTRNNMFNENPNRGYVYNFGKNKLPPEETIMSIEGKFITANIKTIKFLAKTALLTMHEDDTIKDFFLYSSTKKKTPLEALIIESTHKYFNTVEKDKDGEENEIINGTVWNVEDGSLEDYLFRHGTDPCITTETPNNDNLKQRIKANINIFNTFINYYEQL